VAGWKWKKNNCKEDWERVLPSQCSFSHGWDTSTSWDCTKLWWCCWLPWEYHGRKYAYSLTINVINDDHRRIHAYVAGFPGSTHDNRVWKHMKQHWPELLEPVKQCNVEIKIKRSWFDCKIVSFSLLRIKVEMATNNVANIPCTLMGLIGRRMSPLTD
jgi:hypothetical protein